MYLHTNVFGLLANKNDKVQVTRSLSSSWCWPVFISSVIVTLSQLLLTLSYQDILKYHNLNVVVWYLNLSSQVYNLLSFLSTNVSKHASVSNFSSETSKHLFRDAAVCMPSETVYKRLQSLQNLTIPYCLSLFISNHLHIYKIVFPKPSKSLCSKIYIAKYIISKVNCFVHLFL